MSWLLLQNWKCLTSFSRSYCVLINWASKWNPNIKLTHTYIKGPQCIFLARDLCILKRCLFACTPSRKKTLSILQIYCKTRVVVLTNVIVISVSPELFLSLRTFFFKDRTFPSRKLTVWVYIEAQCAYLILCITSYIVINTRKNYQKFISINKESLESTSYLHKQDFVSVFLTRISTSGGLRKWKIKFKHKLCTQTEETETTQNSQNNHRVFAEIN